MSHSSAPWQEILRMNFTHWETLADYLELNAQQRESILKKSTFALNLSRRVAEKIEKRTLTDPILLQFLPTNKELIQTPGFLCDPVGDQASRKSSKLLHKYKGRALLVCTSACAMHCRYCFRQNFEYDVANKSFEDELEAISNDSTIHEVLLSGGDPLSLSDRVLRGLLTDLDKIPHVKRIRLHTRFPIGIPERIDEQFLNMMSNVKSQIYFVIHSNHPKELDEDIFFHLKKLQKLGVILLCQTVLLKGVNDSVDVLKGLFECLVDNGILPYYLHQLDRIQGRAHFEVEEEKGLALMKTLAKELPGYALPEYVREIAGEPYKVPLV